MRALLFGILLVAAVARTASAGVCVDESEANDGMKAIEAFAKNKAKEKAVDEVYGWLCVELAAVRLKPRIERACRAILDRDGIKSQCTKLAAAAGIPKLGDHDIQAFVVAMPDDPLLYSGHSLDVTRIMMLGRMGDPQVVTGIVEQWKETIPRAAKNEKRRPMMMGWSTWRQQAAETLGKLGGQDEIPFLEEQAQATKDKFVAKACRDAITAIQKRLAAAPAQQPSAPQPPTPAPDSAPQTPQKPVK